MIGAWSPGARLGPYVLERELGRGGMGVVYLARDTQTGAAVVIKTLTSLEVDEVARLEREGLALARLEHPNLIRVHGAGWHERRPYLVLQLARGGSLADRLKQGPLTWEEVVPLGAQLADALTAAHALGITHRDLKPENVLLDEHGTPLLADFGLAKLTDLSRLTETGAVLGTPLYMAPEQATGVDSGAAADVYSLGALLYASISGQPPIPRQPGGVVAQLIALQEKAPPPLSGLSDVPRWVEKLIHSALERDPSRRPSAAELAAQLRSPIVETGKNAGVLLVSSLCLVLLVLVSAGAWVTRGSTPARPSAASTPAVSARRPAPSPTAPSTNDAYDLSASVMRDLKASIREVKAEIAAQGLSPSDRAYLSSLEDLDETKLAGYARHYSQDDEEARIHRANWAALELSLRGFHDWLYVACRGALDVRDQLPPVQRLARSGHAKAQWLLYRIRSFGESERQLAYRDAQFHLSVSTSLSTLRFNARSMTLAPDQQAARTTPPRNVGQAWLRIYDFEELLTLSSAQTKARRALAAVDLKAALSRYLEAWRGRAGDSESLAFELAAAAEWKWSRHLRHLGHPYTAGAPDLEDVDTRLALRKDIQSVLDEVAWGRGYYLLALTYLADCRPGRPYPPPNDLPAFKAAVQRAARLDPGLPQTRLLQALTLVWEGDRRSALKELRALDSMTPDWRAPGALVEAWILLRECDEEGGPLPESTKKAYQRALAARDPNRSSGWVKNLQNLFEQLSKRE